MEIPGGDRFLSADCHHQEVTNSDLPGFCKIEVQRGNNMMVVKCSKQRQAEMIQNLKEIISPIAPKYNLNLIILYGSRARGDFRQDSDYDLYIPEGNFNGLIHLIQFEEELEKEINRKIDITTASVDELDEYMINEIKKDGIIIYKRK